MQLIILFKASNTFIFGEARTFATETHDDFILSRMSSSSLMGHGNSFKDLERKLKKKNNFFPVVNRPSFNMGYPLIISGYPMSLSVLVLTVTLYKCLMIMVNIIGAT